MDFFASQELARRNTRWLIIYFILAVICLVIAVYFLVMLAFGYMKHSGGGQSFGPSDLFNAEVLGGVALGVSTVVGGGSLYRVASLRGGGESVAAMLGGRRVPPNANDPDERKILNVVEEMALAAGTPVPPVYILDNEEGINAFAAGYTIDDAVIGINRGTIQQLNRDELQGVIAHEFSHILNGDMRMSIRMIGVLFGIQLLALIGYYILRGFGAGHRRRSRDDGKGAAAILVLAAGLIVIGWIGMFFARLIKASVSRQREYLADASAVQFTRNPDGIAGALKMIGASQQGSQMEAAGAEETSHMFFASMFKRNFIGLFATHPPLLNRVKAIEPNFDGDFVAYARPRFEKARRQAERERQKTEQGGRSRFGFPGGGMFPGMLGDRFPIDPAILIAGVGLPDNDDMHYSKVLVDRIPEPIAVAARDTFSARCLVFASLLDPKTDLRRAQLHALAEAENQATIDETIRLISAVDELEACYRLPVFEILQGTLTGISPEQYESFRASVNRLALADHKIDLFEFFLRHHLLVHLDRRFGLISPPKSKYRAINAVRNEFCILLAIVSRVGHRSEDEALAGFLRGIESLNLPWEADAKRVQTPFDAGLVNGALAKLNESSLAIKKNMLKAIAVTITQDGQVTVEEAEMFRAISESLDCPVPPVMASRQSV